MWLQTPITYKLSDNVKKSIQSDKQNVKALDQLVFVRAEIELYSIGRKNIVELYSLNPNAAPAYESRMIL